MTKREKKIGILMGIIIAVWLFITLSKGDDQPPALPLPLTKAGVSAPVVEKKESISAADLALLKKHIEKGVRSNANGAMRNPFEPIERVEKEADFDIGHLRLMGVLFEDGVPNAVINDLIVREGDVIEDCTVERITATRVTIVRGPERFTLKLYPDVKKKVVTP